MNNSKNSGFTLVELLIVVIILGILAAVVIPQFNSAASESKEASLASNLASLRQTIELYKVQHDDAYPTKLAIQLTEQTNAKGNAGTQYGPYIRNGMPKNAVNGLNNVTHVATMPSSPDGSSGWLYDTVTGDLRANVDGIGPSGTSYFGL